MTDLTIAAADLLQGAEAIAEFCRQCGLTAMNRKKVCQWREAGKLPVGKVGGHLIASKTAITAALTNAATKVAPPATYASPRSRVTRRHRRSA
jgi:hypothetical protein